jgi:hypothetical protein
MKKFNTKDYWLNDKSVKEGISKKEVVSKMIVELGEKLIGEMLLEKYQNMVEESIDKNLTQRGFTERTIYKSKINNKI